MDRVQDLDRFCNDFARRWCPRKWKQPEIGFWYPDGFERLWWPTDLVRTHLTFDEQRQIYVFQVLPIVGWLIERRLLNVPEYSDYDEAAAKIGVTEDTYVFNHPLYRNVRSVFESASIGHGPGNKYSVFKRGRPLLLDMTQGDNGQLPAKYANLIAPLGSEDSPGENHLISFPFFNDLPYEIRRYIWELFCPDLVTPTRVLNFEQWHWFTQPSVSYIGPSIREREATRALRALLSIHSETRRIVQSVFPDTLYFTAADGRWGYRAVVGQLPFQKERDIVCVERINPYNIGALDKPHDPQAYAQVLNDFCSKVRHLAHREEMVDRGSRPSSDLGRSAVNVARLFPNLQTFYALKRYRSRHVHWATKAHVHRLARQTGPWIYAWPKSTSGPDYDALRVHNEVKELTDAMDEHIRITPAWADLRAETSPRGWEVLPMAEIPEGDYPWIVKDAEEHRERYDDSGDESDESQGMYWRWRRSAEHVLMNRMSEATGLGPFSRESWEEFKRAHNGR